MTRTTIIKKCVEIIDNHEEEDCECWRVGYYLSYDNGKIQFHRITTSPTGESSGWGYIDTKSNGNIIREWEATIEDYCNLAVMFANSEREHLKYEYGYNAECIIFKPIQGGNEE